MKKNIAALLLLSIVPFAGVSGQSLQQYNNHPKKAFFESAEARRIGDQVLLWQRETGGWPKNVDMVKPMTDSLRTEVMAQKSRRNDSTTDNGATSQQMIFLAYLYQSTGEERYREAFRQGVEYLLSGQYPNGGWPQFWPERRDYQWHITYNDNAMVNTLCLLRDIVSQQPPFEDNLTSGKLRRKAQKAFDKGIDCIHATQIRVDGRPTIWCQQHDHKTLLPAPARAYELASYCPVESAELIRLLMELPKPDKHVRASINGAMAWLEAHKLEGIRVENFVNEEGKYDRRVVQDEKATPQWARFYDLEEELPFFCDRDGIPRRQLSEIGYERRTGYSWYNASPSRLFPLYEKWKQQHGVKNGL